MMPAGKSEIPFVIYLIPFLAGIACGLAFLPPSSFLLLWFVLIGLAAAIILLNLYFKKLQLYKYRWLGGLTVHLFLFAAGWLLLVNNNELKSNDHFSKRPATSLVVTISNEPVLKNGILRFKAFATRGINKNSSYPVTGNILLVLKSNNDDILHYGDVLLIPSDYRPIDPPANPAEFNYKSYLANQNIHFQEFLFPNQYRIISAGNGNPLIAWSYSLRRHLVKMLKENIYSKEAAGVAAKLILGYKADLDEDVLQVYAKTGTTHVLSVSGAQVAILFVLLEFMFGWLINVPHGRAVKTGLIVTGILYYAVLTGLSPAVCRAAFMLSLVLIGKTFSRTISTLNLLAFSAFLLLLYDPLLISDAGFQLTYLAVSGLLLFQPAVYKWFTFKNKWLDKIWLLASITITAQLVVLPLSSWYFHQLPVYFLLSNLLVIIPAALVMYAGIVYFLLGSINVIGKILAFIIEKIILLMDGSLQMVEHAPGASINKIWLSPMSFASLCLVIVFSCYLLLNRKIAVLRITLVALLLFAISVSWKRYRNLQTKESVAFYIRKHRAIAYRAGNQAVVLTDLSDTDKAFRYSVQPYLDSCQVENLKLVSAEGRKNLEISGNKSIIIKSN